MKTFTAALIAATMLSGHAMAQPAPVDGDKWIMGTPAHLWKNAGGMAVDLGEIQHPAGNVITLCNDPEHCFTTSVGSGAPGTIPQVDADGQVKWVTVCGMLSPVAIQQIKDALK